MNNFFYQRLNAFKLLQADFPLSNETETIYPQSEPNHTHTYIKMHTETKPTHLVSYHVLVALNKISNAQPNRSQTFIKFDFLCHKAFLLTYLFCHSLCTQWTRHYCLSLFWIHWQKQGMWFSFLFSVISTVYKCCVV